MYLSQILPSEAISHAPDIWGSSSKLDSPWRRAPVPSLPHKRWCWPCKLVKTYHLVRGAVLLVVVGGVWLLALCAVISPGPVVGTPTPTQRPKRSYCMYVHAGGPRYVALVVTMFASAPVVLGNIECPVSLANTLPRFSTCVGLRGLAMVRGCRSWVECVHRKNLRAKDFVKCIDSSDVHIVLDLDLHNHFRKALTWAANNAQPAGAGGGETVVEPDGLSGRSGNQAHASAPASSDAVAVSAVTTQSEGVAMRASSGALVTRASPAAPTGQGVATQGVSPAGDVVPRELSRGRQRPSQKRPRESGASAAGGAKRTFKKGRLLTDGDVVLDASAPFILPDASRSAAQQIEELEAQVHALQASVHALKARLRDEKKHRHAAALTSVCKGIDLEELKAILGRAGLTNFTPVAPTWLGIELTVFGIKHVHDTASKVLAASSCTPAGILRSMLLKVANPEEELRHVVLSRVVDYIHQESAHEWPAEQLTHLRGATALATVLTNESIRDLQFQQGELTLECMQVWLVVRLALAAVFKTLHGYGVLLFGCTHLALTACSIH